MVKQIVLWRHGQTDYNREGRFQGQFDVPLNAHGLAQAKATAPVVAAFGIDSIHSSDLTRAFQTATALAEYTGLPVEKNPLLRELSVGDWEGKTREDIGRIWPDQLEAWNTGQDVRPPNGESRAESTARVVAAIHEIVANAGEDESVAIVAHGAVLRGAAEALLGLGADHTGYLGVMMNCGYGVLTPRRGTWVLRQWSAGEDPGAVA
ncbi:histidine phosphatase family protein [Brevibacterium samyangense]|uniref:Histidine phosphatase family protein n=1 Tax=Brevibacterium samyangense TaxID=366888 RepID=A0ABN2TA37_9MICO